MSLSVVIGGQYGGEGKGKVVAHLARNHGFDVIVRCGGPNSGHTITFDDRQIVLRQVPAGVVNPNSKLFLAAGCLLDLKVLMQEIEFFDLQSEKLKIDNNAVIIDRKNSQKEKDMQLDFKIGSTCTGTGIAVIQRALRTGSVKLARDIPFLKPYLANVSKQITSHYLSGKRILIEGTQGFGLSLYHSPYYPYTTSRDTTASSFLSEVGVSPLVVSDIIMVLRTFPIRVGGNSGPLPKEINWKTIQIESNYPYEIMEFTTVTKRLRRVARFDIEIVKKAAIANMPTKIALMGTDYINYKNNKVKSFDQLTEKTRNFIFWLEDQIGAQISLIGIGPYDNEIIDRIGEYKNDQERNRERNFETIPMSRN